MSLYEWQRKAIMIDRPILFNGEMVPPVMDDSKTQI